MLAGRRQPSRAGGGQQLAGGGGAAGRGRRLQQTGRARAILTGGRRRAESRRDPAERDGSGMSGRRGQQEGRREALRAGSRRRAGHGRVLKANSSAAGGGRLCWGRAGQVGSAGSSGGRGALPHSRPQQEPSRRTQRLPRSCERQRECSQRRPARPACAHASDGGPVPGAVAALGWPAVCRTSLRAEGRPAVLTGSGCQIAGNTTQKDTPLR